MEKVLDIINMLFKKSKYVVAFFVITLFSVVLINNDVYSASFNYSDFDFDKYFEEKGNYWTSGCKENEKCIDEIVKKQRKFYTKLYKLLAKYAEKGIIAQDSYVDNIILETVFINMNPGMFTDDGTEYKNMWGSNGSPYKIDESEMDDVEIDPDVDYSKISEEYANYYSEEKDTLKLLVSNLFSYTTRCYGVYGSPRIVRNADGTTSKICDSGNLEDIPSSGLIGGKVSKCVDKTVNSLGFYKYYISKLQHDHFIAKYFTSLSILGHIPVDEYYQQCMDMSGNYPAGTVYGYMDSGELPKLDTNKYFDFLSYNSYFDGKSHLQEYFEDKVLKPAKVDCMTKDLCDNSLEKAGLYDQYEEEIIKSRRTIIKDIIWILNNYGIKVAYSGVGIEYGEGAYDSDNTGWWWPIGSDTYYSSEPIPTKITSYFGVRSSPTAGASTNHQGLDIAPTVEAYRTSGGDRDLPVIATRDGTVVMATESISGYGKYIKIQHDNGMYSGYGHIKTILVTNGQTVKQGDIIAYMGNEGRSTGKHLHFEIFTDSSTRVDPLSYVNQLSPRPVSSSGKFTAGSENKQSVCLTLKNSGYSDVGIAALLGNIQAESSFNPAADNGSHGGICQWGYTGRYLNLKSFRPYDYTTLEGQVLFMIHELGSSYSSLDEKLRNGVGTANDLGDAVCMKYEAPGRKYCNDRYENPEKVLSYVQNGCN